MSLADQIDVFYGRVTHSAAQVYVRVSSLAGGDEWTITGKVRGPIAPGTRTLPTTVALQDLGKGATLLASCAIPDPTFWTTLLPGTYELNIQLRCHGEVVETVTRSLGIRFFGASGRKFLWEGKRWVLRGVATSESDVAPIDVFRDNVGVLIVRDPVESLLREASEAGVLLAVDLALRGRESFSAKRHETTDAGRPKKTPDPLTRHECTVRLIAELRCLTQWPAVAIVILPNDCHFEKEVRAAAPNLLFAQRIDPEESSTLADWTQVIFCDATDAKSVAAFAKSWPLPVVAERRLKGDYTLIEARRECDHLQRDLAPFGDFAGYVVGIGSA